MHKGCSLWQPPVIQERSSIRRWILYLTEKVLTLLATTVRTGPGYLGKQIMKCQTHHTVPINNGPVAFLGMGVIKNNSRRLGREVVNKFGLAFLLPPTREMTPRSGHGYQQHPQKRLTISEWPHRSQASLIQGLIQRQLWLQKMGSRSTQLQHRKAARQEKEDVLGAHPTIPQHYIGVQFTDPNTQPTFGWLCGKDTMQEKGISDLWTITIPNQQSWHTEETTDHLPPRCWAREVPQHETTDVPNWVPLVPRNNMCRNRR